MKKIWAGFLIIFFLFFTALCMREVFILFFAPHGHSVELIDEVNTNSDYAKYRADMQELSEQADQLAELQE